MNITTRAAATDKGANSQKVFILGATGNVGKELVRQIVENPDCDSSRHPNPTKIVGLASRKKGYFYLQEGIRNRFAKEFSEGMWEGPKYGGPFGLLKILREETVFVDVTDDKVELPAFHLHVIGHTEHSIVTANKFPPAICTFDQFNKLTNDYKRYGLSATVMGGSGLAQFLRDCPDLNDRITRIEGCVSGSCTAISANMEAGMSFSDSVRKEHRDGNTEPDPREDLRGGDAARKACIIGRLAGWKVSLDNVVVTPFVPLEHLADGSVERFLDDRSLDQGLDAQVRENLKSGKVLRYVMNAVNEEGKAHITVGPQFVGQDSPLGSLKGTDNNVIVWTTIYRRGVPFGPVAGAGNEVTARNIRGDLLRNLAERRAHVDATNH